MDSAYSKYQENLHEQLRKSNSQQQQIIEEQNKLQAFLHNPITTRLEGYHMDWNLLWSVIDEINKKGYSIVIESTYVEFRCARGYKPTCRFEVEDTSVRNDDYVATDITKRMVYQSLLKMISFLDVPEWDEVKDVTESCRNCGKNNVTCFCEMD